MAVREALLPAGEREENLAADLNDLSWFDAIDAPTEDGAVFFAAGVFYYFRTEQVRAPLRGHGRAISGWATGI